MREIVLDTETTGLDPLRGDRLVEIGCIEIYNRMPTGQTFTATSIPSATCRRKRLPCTACPASSFPASRCSRKWSRSLEFIGDAPLVIHNASFDISFINAELDRIKRQPILRDRLVDTLLLARRKHPGVSNRLDDLCSRYAIDNSRRTKHGALLDAELLAEVYIDLIGARQSQLILASETRIKSATDLAKRRAGSARSAGAANHDADREAHRAFVATLGDKPIWNDFLGAAGCLAAGLPAFSSASRRKRPGPQPAAPCSGGTDRRNRRDRASRAGSRRRAPRSR